MGVSARALEDSLPVDTRDLASEPDPCIQCGLHQGIAGAQVASVDEVDRVSIGLFDCLSVCLLVDLFVRSPPPNPCSFKRGGCLPFVFSAGSLCK